MAKKKPPQAETIKAITEVRARNNVLWMGLLQLAMEAAPKRAKILVTEITKNDKSISKLIGNL